MSKTRVTHVRAKGDHFEVYIGRPSKWGNPFTIGKDGNRAEVIEKYREYAKEKFSADDLRPLLGKVLGCWCVPLPCHGDVLVEMVEELR